jgi:galactoside O-acetyltransferase
MLASHVFALSELKAMGIGSISHAVSIDRSVRIFGELTKLQLGNNVRSDAFSLMSIGEDGITIGNNVHIAAGCYLYGGGGAIDLHDFSGLAARVTLYTSSADYVSRSLTNTTVDMNLRSVKGGSGVPERHAIIRAGADVLPGVWLAYGAPVAALSTMRDEVEASSVIVGNPTSRLPLVRNLDRLRLREREYVRLAGRGP